MAGNLISHCLLQQAVSDRKAACLPLLSLPLITLTVWNAWPHCPLRAHSSSSWRRCFSWNRPPQQRLVNVKPPNGMRIDVSRWQRRDGGPFPWVISTYHGINHRRTMMIRGPAACWFWVEGRKEINKSAASKCFSYCVARTVNKIEGGKCVKRSGSYHVGYKSFWGENRSQDTPNFFFLFLFFMINLQQNILKKNPSIQAKSQQ